MPVCEIRSPRLIDRASGKERSDNAVRKRYLVPTLPLAQGKLCALPIPVTVNLYPCKCQVARGRIRIELNRSLRVFSSHPKPNCRLGQTDVGPSVRQVRSQSPGRRILRIQLDGLFDIGESVV